MSLAFQNLKIDLDSSDRLTFGKYQGAFLEDVIYNDPRYVLWILANTNNKLSGSATKILAKELILRLDNLSAEVRTRKKLPRLEQAWLELENDDIPF